MDARNFDLDSGIAAFDPKILFKKMTEPRMCKVIAAAPKHPANSDGILKWAVLHECGRESQVFLPIGKGLRPKTVECQSPEEEKLPSIPEPENAKPNVIRISLI